MCVCAFLDLHAATGNTGRRLGDGVLGSTSDNFRQRQQLGCAAASLLVATDTLHKSRRAARTHPLISTVL